MVFGDTILFDTNKANAVTPVTKDIRPIPFTPQSMVVQNNTPFTVTINFNGLLYAAPAFTYCVFLLSDANTGDCQVQITQNAGVTVEANWQVLIQFTDQLLQPQVNSLQPPMNPNANQQVGMTEQVNVQSGTLNLAPGTTVDATVLNAQLDSNIINAFVPTNGSFMSGVTKTAIALSGAGSAYLSFPVLPGAVYNSVQFVINSKNGMLGQYTFDLQQLRFQYSIPTGWQATWVSVNYTLTFSNSSSNNVADTIVSDPIVFPKALAFDSVILAVISSAASSDEIDYFCVLQYMPPVPPDSIANIDASDLAPGSPSTTIFAANSSQKIKRMRFVISWQSGGTGEGSVLIGGSPIDFVALNSTGYTICGPYDFAEGVANIGVQMSMPGYFNIWGYVVYS